MKHFHIEVGFRDKTATFEFDRPSIRIGRLPENDLVLPDASVEERAVTVHRQTGFGRDAFMLRRQSGATQVLTNGANVTIGRYDLTIVRGAALGEREREFLRQLQAHPADDQTRLVYADWLEENAKTAEADFIRAQVELTKLSPDSPAFLRAKDVLHELAGDFPAHWRRTVARPEIENCGMRFELQCPKQWAELQPTIDPDQRFCGTCQRNVYYASTVAKARHLAIAGQCVVVDVAQFRTRDDLKEERYLMAGVMAPPSYG